MLDLDYPRDLVMVGAVFGIAGFVWAGWAQEGPPTHLGWRIVLGLLAVGGLLLATVSVSMAIGHWSTPTALAGGTVALRVYIIVFWAEVLLAAALAFLAIRAGRSDLIGPLILAVVGIHFFALAPVFGQPVLHLAAGLLTACAIFAALAPCDSIARSFWCGILSAPIFIAIGAWCTAAGSSAFRHL